MAEASCGLAALARFGQTSAPLSFLMYLALYLALYLVLYLAWYLALYLAWRTFASTGSGVKVAPHTGGGGGGCLLAGRDVSEL